MQRIQTIRTLRITGLSILLLGLLIACGPSTPATQDHSDHDHDEHSEQAHVEDEHDAAPDAGAAHDHDGDADHDDMVRALQLDAEQRAVNGIELAVAEGGALEVTTELPGEVRINGDRLAHVTPRVGGVVHQVLHSLGDRVAAGELLAILESRELADAKAHYLAARERVRLAEATFEREQRLWQQRVTSEQELLDAENALAEARIELRLDEQGLRTLGLDDDDLQALVARPDDAFTWYRITAPFAGEVIDRHLTLGEMVAAEEPVFTVADLETVWIDLQVYQKDLGVVEPGQQVRVVTDHGTEARLTIDLVQPLVGEDTRTALARIIAANRDGMWHPGCFVTAHVTLSSVAVEVRLPRSALVRLEGDGDVVFIEDEDGLEPRPVRLGRQDHDHVEVVAGLSAGEHYVARGAFTLKAELMKSSFAGHGHAH